MISYVKARAEALDGECPEGLMERDARIVTLCAWALGLTLLPRWQAVILVGGTLTGLTVVQRIRWVRNLL